MALVTESMVTIDTGMSTLSTTTTTTTSALGFKDLVDAVLIDTIGLDPASTIYRGITIFDDPLYLLLIPYCVGQPLFRSFCKSTGFYEKNKVSCKNVMCWYNLILAGFSLWSALYMMYALAFEIPDGVYGLNHFTSSRYAYVSYIFYLSKYVEFLDTYFLILCDRPVIWLQYLHHMGAPLDMGILCANKVEGVWIYVVFNGIIHTIMYYYYACCIMKWPFPWKRMITNLQLIQFFSGFGCVMPYIFMADYRNDFGKCFSWCFNACYLLMNVVMFTNFYRQTYLKKKATSSQAGIQNGTNPTSGSKPITNDQTHPQTSTDIHILYKNVRIPITKDWQNKHPGGTKILKIFNERDSTDVVLATHSEQARSMIESLAKQAIMVQKSNSNDDIVVKSESEISEISVSIDLDQASQILNDGYEESDYYKLYRKAEELNLFQANVFDEVLKAFYSFGSVFLGVYLMGLGGYGWTGVSFIAFGWFQLGWLGHDWSHHTALILEDNRNRFNKSSANTSTQVSKSISKTSNTKSCVSNDWLSWASTIIRGTTLLNWKLRHNTHHCATNEIGNDPDIKLSPLFHFFEDFEVSTLTGLQHLYYVPGIGMLHIYWHYESWMASKNHFNSKNKVNRFWARADVIALLLHWCFLTMIGYIAIHYGNETLSSTILKLVFGYYISGLGTALVVFSSHYAEERIDPSQAKEQNIGLLEETSRTVRNIKSFSGYPLEEEFWYHLTGGLNVQFEHHLFPMMPRCNLRKMTPFIKEVCKERGYPFEESNLYDCVQKCVIPLKENVERNLVRMGMMKKSKKDSGSNQVEDIHNRYKTYPRSGEVTIAASFTGSLRLMTKTILLLVLGYLFTSGKTFINTSSESSGVGMGLSSIHIILGVIFSGVALTALDHVRQDCRGGIFFPKESFLGRVLNRSFAFVLDKLLASWVFVIGVVVLVAGIHYANTAVGVGSNTNFRLNVNESDSYIIRLCENFLYSLKYYLLPLLLMRLNVHVTSNINDNSSEDRLMPGLGQKMTMLVEKAESLVNESSSCAEDNDLTGHGEGPEGSNNNDIDGPGTNIVRKRSSVRTPKTPVEKGTGFNASKGSDSTGPTETSTDDIDDSDLLPSLRRSLSQINSIPLYRINHFVKAVESDLLDIFAEAEALKQNVLSDVCSVASEVMEGIEEIGYNAGSTPMGLEEIGKEEEDNVNVIEAEDVNGNSNSSSNLKHTPSSNSIQSSLSSNSNESADESDTTDHLIDGPTTTTNSMTSNCSGSSSYDSEDPTPTSEGNGPKNNLTVGKLREFDAARTESDHDAGFVKIRDINNVINKGNNSKNTNSTTTKSSSSSITNTLLYKPLYFLLTPIRHIFQSIFLWQSRDLALYVVVSIYLAMTYIGFKYYFSYAPVCVLFGFFYPKSAAGKFMKREIFGEVDIKRMNKKNLKKAELESNIDLNSIFGSDPNSLLPWKRYRLNHFMCFYIGICHVLAFHAISNLVFFGGKDVVLSWGDAIIKGYAKEVMGIIYKFMSGNTVTDINEAPTVPVETITASTSNATSSHFDFSQDNFLQPVKTQTLIFAFLLWPISGLGITAGAHRLWAHKSYDAHFITRLILMIFNSIANQGSIYHWARDHRTHHHHSDTELDPHNSHMGWFYSHMGWLLVQKPKSVVDAGRNVDVRDLKRDILVMFQKKVDPWWNMLFCFAIPGFLSVYFFNDTLWNGFLYAGVLRYVWVLHCTWSVNSIVHTYGPRIYDPEEPPSESRLVSFLAIGEGWHSWHHAFAFDYATSELGCLEQWNPTKFFIDMLANMGLVSNRKRGLRMWEERKKRMSEKNKEKYNVRMVEKLEGPMMWKIRKIDWVDDETGKVVEWEKIDEVNGNSTDVKPNTNRNSDITTGNLTESDSNTKVKQSVQFEYPPYPSYSQVSAGELDKIVDIDDWVKAANGLTKETVMNSIPDRLKQRHAWKSFLFLIRDSIYLTMGIGVFVWLKDFEYKGEIDILSFKIEEGMHEKVVPSATAMVSGDTVTATESTSIQPLSTLSINISIPHLLQTSLLFQLLFFSAYAIINGTIATGLWVIGHECGHGAFSNSSTLNDIVGYITHNTFLLVPYFGWQFSHGKHHKYTNHTTLGETHVPPTKRTWLHNLKSGMKMIGRKVSKLGFIPNIKTQNVTSLVDAFCDIYSASLDAFLHLFLGWPLYLIFNLTGGRENWKGDRLKKSNLSAISHFSFGTGSELFPPQWSFRVNLSAIGVVVMLFGLGIWAKERGFWEMGCWFLAPYSITNLWLVLYTWLHHTHEDVPHFGKNSFNWLRGALCTIDRPYSPLINHLHHHIGSTHVLHHLNSKIPHYHAEEATECIKKVLVPLNLYRYDGRGIVEALFDVTRTCEYIEGLEGVQFYKKKDESHSLSNNTDSLRSKMKENKLNSDSASTSAGSSSTSEPDSEDEPKNNNIKKHEILIDGKIYDVTNYVKKHPGGNIITFMSGTDGTETFRQFHHRSERAKKVLKSLPNREPESEDSDSVEPNSNSSDKSGSESGPESLKSSDSVFKFPDADVALLKDFRKLELQLEKEGYFEASIPHVIYRCSEVVIMYAIGFYLTKLGFDGYNISGITPINVLQIVSGLLFAAVAQGRCGWLMHEGGHFSLTGNMDIDRRLHEFIYGVGCGMSGSWWRNQHNKHHATPQKHGHDVDLNTLPLVAFHKECVLDSKIGRYLMGTSSNSKSNSKSDSDSNKTSTSKLSLWSKFWLTNQAYLFSPLICLLVALFWQFFLHPRHSLRKGNYQEVFYMGLRYIGFYMFLCSSESLSESESYQSESGLGGPGLSLPSALLWYLIYVQIGASYIFTNFAVSHTHLPTVDKDDNSKTWVHYASDHTMNVGVNSKLVSWWMGYLNFQIEHHLFPQMPQYRFPEISHRVKELFETHGREYLTEDYFKAIWITMQNLDEVAKDAIEEFGQDTD